MDRRKYYKNLFMIGALWNVCVGPGFFILSFFGDIGWNLMEMQVPPSLFFFHVIALWTIVFGVGFFIVGQNIDKNHGILLLGILEKTIFLIAAIIYVILGDANFLLITIGLVDLIFVILYLEFLIRSKSL